MEHVNKLNYDTVIILLNYNGLSIKYKNKPILKSCLRYLNQSKYTRTKILTIDNGSNDDSVKFLRSNHLETIIIKKNIPNFSKVVNIGISEAVRKYPSKYLVLLSNDVFLIQKGWLSKVTKLAKYHNKAGIFGCKLLYPNKKIQHAGLWIGSASYNRGRAENDMGQYNEIEKVPGVTFALVLIKTKLIKKIGLLDENFQMGYEDADYCLRARTNNFEVLYIGKIKAIHLEGYTTKLIKNSNNISNYFYKSQTNSSYFAFKNLKGISLFKSIILILISSLLSIESENRTRNITNLRIKKNLKDNIYHTFKGLIIGYNLAKQFNSVKQRKINI